MIKNLNPLVSIIIPTFNEEEDIRKTLEACVALDYLKKEIIVVDDSTDKTPKIAQEYKDRGVKLIHREKNEGGRSGARNTGILLTRGDILIILNADVLLPKDFIHRILEHYQKGAGYVLIESRVINEEYLIARFIGSLHRYVHRFGENKEGQFWTEGFSCLRKAALKAGLFPIPPLALTAGEDGYFGRKIHSLGYKKVIDRSIVVTHFAPYCLKDFWRIMRERICVPANYFLENKSFLSIVLRAIGRTFILVVTLLTIIPLLIMAYRIAKYSPKKNKDILPFAYVYAIRQLAFLVGKWKGFFTLARYTIFET